MGRVRNRLLRRNGGPAGYIGKHSFPSGPPSPHTYVILCDGCHYAVRHSVVALSIVDSRLRRRISKQGNPKALA